MKMKKIKSPLSPSRFTGPLTPSRASFSAGASARCRPLAAAAAPPAMSAADGEVHEGERGTNVAGEVGGHRADPGGRFLGAEIN